MMPSFWEPSGVARLRSGPCLMDKSTNDVLRSINMLFSTINLLFPTLRSERLANLEIFIILNVSSLELF
jgi:hypothetical protein